MVTTLTGIKVLPLPVGNSHTKITIRHTDRSRSDQRFVGQGCAAAAAGPLSTGVRIWAWCLSAGPSLPSMASGRPLRTGAQSVWRDWLSWA